MCNLSWEKMRLSSAASNQVRISCTTLLLVAGFPQPSSSWSSQSTSCFEPPPSQYRLGTSQFFFSKPLHFGVPASLVNLLLDDIPKILSWMKLWESKRVSYISTLVGLKMGISALVLTTTPHLPLFQLWPKLRTSDSLVCPNSSLPHNSGVNGHVSTHLCSQFHWGNSLLGTDGLTSWFPFFSGIFTFRRPLFAYLFAVFLVSMHWRTLNGGPVQSHLHKWWFKIDTFPRSKIYIFPVHLSKHIPALKIERR